jgi:hypothetical protein
VCLSVCFCVCECVCLCVSVCVCVLLLVQIINIKTARYVPYIKTIDAQQTQIYIIYKTIKLQL